MENPFEQFLGQQQADFEKEALTLSKLSHPNVVQFLGIHYNEEGEKFLVFEYLAGGSLVYFFQEHGENMTTGELIHMIIEAARGMVYLEAKGIVHRDIALRNFLIDDNKKVKVSDFGMAIRSFYGGFVTGSDVQTIPVRWSAPEILRQAPPTSKSDVYSFGVFMWEVFELGKIPYGGLGNSEVIKKVLDDKELLPKPERCPFDVYKLMLKCFALLPTKRPSFKDILDTMEQIQTGFEKQNTEQRTRNTFTKSNDAVSLEGDDLYSNEPSMDSKQEH